MKMQDKAGTKGSLEWVQFALATAHLGIVHAAALHQISAGTKATRPAPNDGSPQRLLAPHGGQRRRQLVEHGATERVLRLGFVQLHEGDAGEGKLEGAQRRVAGEVAE